MDFNLILGRIRRLARLDTSVFDEVRDDQRELVPALIIVAVSALLAGIGVWLWLIFVGPDGYDVDIANVFLKIILIGTIFTAVLWAVWVLVTYVVLLQFYKEQVDLQSLFRTMGYAAFPFSLSLLMLVPWFSMAFGIAALVLWFVMSIYAIQAATGVSSDKVIMANLAGFLVFAAILGLIARESGLSTGVFVNSESMAVSEGEFYELPNFDLGDIIN